MFKNVCKDLFIRFRSLLVFLACLSMLTAFDLLTKQAAAGALKGKMPFILIKNVLQLEYLENTGIAFGMFPGSRIFFMLVSAAVIAALFWAAARMPFNRKYAWLLAAVTFLGAGAVGNFIDRIALGYVRDFIYFKLINFPVFNIADAYITVGFIMLGFLMLFVYSEDDYDFMKL